jgi:ABC-2 type transport system permease protein
LEYPIAIMPGWLRAIASANPLTYEVDGLRAVMLANGGSAYGLAHDLAALALTGVLMIAVATGMYPRMTQ